MANATVPLSNILLNIQLQLIRYADSIYMIFGITGCILNILLLSRPQFCTSSCCTYLLAMNAIMMVHLSVGLGTRLYRLNNIDPMTTILALCKLRPYILQSTAMIYRWCLTVACFDRYALSSANARLRNFAKVRTAWCIIASIILVWILLPVHILIFHDLKGNTCGFVHSIAAAYYHSIFTTVTGGILPIAIMVACAVLTYCNLDLKQKRRRDLTTFSQAKTDQRLRNNSQTRRDRQVLAMLLIQVVIYAILMTPLMVWYFYNSITLSVSNKSSDRVAIERFAMFMAELIILAFPILSFYLYTMSSQIFRKELTMLMHSALTCKSLNNINRVGVMLTAGNEIMRPAVKH